MGTQPAVSAQAEQALPPSDLYLDGCPACTARGNAPLSLLVTGRLAVAQYICRRCPTTWTTSWVTSADPVPLLTDSGATGRTTP